MQKLSSIVTKKDLQQHWHDFEPNTSLVYAYAVGVHEKVSLLLDCKGSVRSAYWGTNHDPAKKSIERPYVLFERAHIKPSFRMAFRSRRAVALIDSFYVWNRQQRRPYRVFLPEQPLLFIPALFFEMEDQSTCCTLLVRNSRPQLSQLTAVEPISLDHDSISTWIHHDTSVTTCIDLLKNAKSPLFNTHLVSNKILVRGFSDKILHSVSKSSPSLFEVCE